MKASELIKRLERYNEDSRVLIPDPLDIWHQEPVAHIVSLLGGTWLRLEGKTKEEKEYAITIMALLHTTYMIRELTKSEKELAREILKSSPNVPCSFGETL